MRLAARLSGPPVRPHQKNEPPARTRQTNVVPMNAIMKVGLMTVTLMAFMAAAPCADGRRLSAAITKDENVEDAANNPAADCSREGEGKDGAIKHGCLPRHRSPPSGGHSRKIPEADVPGRAGRHRPAACCGRRARW